MSKALLLISCLIISGFSVHAQSWQQRGGDIIGKANSEGIGNSTSLSWDGKILAVGASSANSLGGLVRVFEWNGSAWSQKGSDMNGATGSADQLGASVSLDSSGKTLAVGAPYADAGFGQYSNSGYVKIYSWSGTAWVQKGSTINAADSAENCGYSVSLSSDGTTIAIGAAGNAGGGKGRGQVRIYSWSGSAWVQKGGKINGEGDYDVFGNSVSLDRTGNKVAIGAPLNSGNGTNAGHVRVFSWSGSAWVQQGGDIDGDADSDNSGYSVSLSKSGSRLAVGAPQDFMGGYGYTKIYDWSGTAWVQKGSTISSAIDADEFGNNVSLSGNGDYLAIGARGAATGNEKGRAEVYNWSGSAWQQSGSSIIGQEDYGKFGHSVTTNFAGNLFASSEPSFNGSGSILGSVRVYRFAGPCSTTYSTTTISACGSYTWNNNSYTASGTYKDTIPNAEGCDSIMTLNLTLIKSTSQTMATAICGNDQYTSPSGKKFTASGTYADTLKSKSGCDSIIYSITVTKKIPNVDGFVLKDTSIVGVNYGAVASGDLDKNGYQDIIVSGLSKTGNLVAQVYLNGGNDSLVLLPGTNFTGAQNGNVSIVDINGDNYPEVFISGTNTTNKPTALFYKNNGNGTFSQITTAPFDKLMGTKHVFADVDKDGDQDLVISSGDSVFLYKNNTGTFSSNATVVTNSKADNLLLAADLNGDGYADVIKAGYQGSIMRLQLLLNDRAGNFTASSPFGNINSTSAAIADFNQDGNPDFLIGGVTTGNRSMTKIYNNDGLGNFTVADTTSLKSLTWGNLTVADFNADGQQDVFMSGMSELGAPESRLYIKNNQGNFVIASNLPVPALILPGLKAVDLNNDGLKELVITGANSSNYQPSAAIFKNKGCFAPCESESEITVKNCGPYTSPSGKVWTESGTYVDVIPNAAGCDSMITIHLKTGSSSSMAAVACDSFIAPSGKVYYSSGEYKDVLNGANEWGCDSTINISLNISSGVKISQIDFTEMSSFNIKRPDINSVVVADVDGDNKEELLIATDYEGFKIYKSNGDGSFAEMAGTNLPAVFDAYATTGDVNGDNKPDILISGKFNLDDEQPRIYINNGGGSFTKMAGTNFLALDTKLMVIKDLDGDSKADILMSGYNYWPNFKNFTKLYKNNGDGTFTEVTGTGLPPNMARMAVEDLNGDKKPDILIISDGLTRIYQNNGGNNFSVLTGTNFLDFQTGSIAVADVNNDSRPDVLLSGLTSYNTSISKAYKNNGGGSFSEMAGANFTDINASYGSISVADMDNDNNPDILISGGINYKRVNKLYKNKGEGVFSEMNLPVNWVGSVINLIIDADGDTHPDFISFNLGNTAALYRNIVKTFTGACIAPTGCNTYTSPSGKYTWTKSGVYKDTIILADHDSIITINLLIDSLSANFTQKTDPDGNFNALIVNKSKGKNMRFVWNFGDGDSSTLATPTHTYATGGTYNLCLTVTTGAGCTAKFCKELTFHGKKEGPYTIAVVDSIDGTMATGIEESPVAGNTNLSFSIYPNPATNLLNVLDKNEGVFNISVLDLSGRRIVSYKNQQTQSVLDLSAYKAGMYIIEIQTRNGNGYYKILKQ